MRCGKTGKQMLTSREAVRQAAWWKRERFARMHHYKCKSCGAWHIGNARYQRRR